MKKLSKIASLTLAAALTLSVAACTNGGTSGGISGGDRQDGATKIEFKTGNDFFAMSAASGVSFLDTAGSAKRAGRRMRMLKNGEEMPLTQEQTEQPDQSESGQQPSEVELARPAEFTDENIAEIKNSLTMFESVVGGGVSSTVESCGEADGEYAAYAYKMTITFGGETAVMYYNERDTKTETDDDETETQTTLSGKLVSGENEYEANGKRKEETSGDEKEFELELVIKKSENTFVKFSYSTETETNENETEYECEIYENGKKIQETEISIEEEDGETEIKFEFKNGGKKDGVEYKIVKRDATRFDIRREQNKKKSYILAEKTADGYKFTYSNGYSETV